MQAVQLVSITPEELQNIIKSAVTEAIKKLPQASAPEDKIMSIDEAANFLKISHLTVYSYTAKLKIPFMKQGRRLYFSQKALTDWLTTKNHRARA